MTILRDLFGADPVIRIIFVGLFGATLFLAIAAAILEGPATLRQLRLELREWLPVRKAPDPALMRGRAYAVSAIRERLTFLAIYPEQLEQPDRLQWIAEDYVDAVLAITRGASLDIVKPAPARIVPSADDRVFQRRHRGPRNNQ